MSDDFDPLGDVREAIDRLHQAVLGNDVQFPSFDEPPGTEEALDGILRNISSWARGVIGEYGAASHRDRDGTVLGLFSARSVGGGVYCAADILGRLPERFLHTGPIDFLERVARAREIEHPDGKGMLPVTMERWTDVAPLLQAARKAAYARALGLVGYVRARFDEDEEAVFPRIAWVQELARGRVEVEVYDRRPDAELVVSY